MKNRLFGLFLIFAFLAVLLMFVPMKPAQAVSNDIVISQVYGGGGNSGAPYRNDFVELFNRGTATVSLSGMSIQYASATGTGNFSNNPVTLLSGSLAPGQYYLVQQSGGTTGDALPTPDAIGTANMSGSSGKVVLVNSTSGLACNGFSTPCSTEQLALIKDLVGYGGANFFEGTPAPTLSNTTAALRLTNGCTESDNNFSDFSAGTPLPRNTASPLNPCTAPPPNDAAPFVTSTTPANGATDVPVNLTVIRFSFSEAVAASDTSFAFSCASIGPVAFNASALGTGESYDVAPSNYLPAGDTCTVTALASGITDLDTDDPLDNMAADHTISFTTQPATPVCEQAYTPVYAIQGSGLSAAVTGNVTTQGVVVGDFEGSNSVGIGGFYLQDLSGDGDPATSDGIFVFTGSADLVSAGEVVRVTGFARERFNQTAINGSNSNSSAVTSANIVSCGTGSVAPVDVYMPFSDGAYLERFEGMLVRFPQSLVISEYFNYDRFGELVIALPLDGEPRPFSGTALDEPGAPANARTLANSLRRITLDDGLGSQNPPALRHPNGSNFSLINIFRGGDTLRNTVGVLGYDFSLYRIQPTGPAEYTPANPRPAAPEPVGGSLRIAALNTLNFFLTPDYPTGDPLDNKCGPLQNVECRGWDSDQVDELTRQRDKLVAALAGLDADIIGLNELENTSGVDPLGDPNGLVAGLNALMTGADLYAYIDTGVIGTDAIRVGLIYRPAKVTPVSAFQILDSTDDPRFLDTKNRPSLAQTFQDVSTGGRFTVVVNHLKSKGSDCIDVGDPDLGDGQGNCSQTRTLAAQALVDWLATDPTGSGDPDFIIIGDLNAYAKEDVIDAILAGSDDTTGTGDDFANLIAQFQGAYAYSYVFDGQFGYLDHALANERMLAQVTGAATWHINADESDVLDYDTTFKSNEQDGLYERNGYRSSDHDPVVVGLNAVNDPPELGTILAAPDLVSIGTSISARATFTDPDILDTHTAVWGWGDGSTSSGVVSEADGAGTIEGTHAYAAPGVYAVSVTVDDGYGNTDQGVYEFVVVYDQNGGFVTGGGWIDSPMGAYFPDPSLTGKATFGFVSKYKKGANTPVGNTEFKFQAGGLNFLSNSYEWLVVNRGGTNAQFKGTGLLNGALDPNGNAYKFMLWAGDGSSPGGADTFRMRIWWEDAGGVEYEVYDNGFAGSGYEAGQPLNGGSIVIHTSGR